MELIRCRTVSSSVCPSICLSTFFPNWIGYLNCHPIFTIFGLNVHNDMAQKFVQIEFWSFASCFFTGCLIKTQSFYTRPWNLLYRHIVGTFKCVKNGPSRPNFRAVLAPNKVFIYCLSTGNLIYKLVGATFVPREAQICRPIKASKWVKIQVFGYFVK